MQQKPQYWDIFCAVVDNFGDIGICWRLSRQLVAEHGIAVRLWVDDLRDLPTIVVRTVTYTGAKLPVAIRLVK
ncbi:hypothetical protein ALON55S_01159 [Alishewanella longhuensis]